MTARTTTVTAFVRPTRLSEPIDDTIDTLHQLESRDQIDDLSIRDWPAALTLSERTSDSAAIEAFKRMEAWADAHGFSIRPPFSVRTSTSIVSDNTEIQLRTPTMCLAVRVDGQLVNVFPHSRGDDQYNVTDAIAALRADDLELHPFAYETAASPPDRCSTCENRLTDVQGIGVCQNCDRIELDSTARLEPEQGSRLANRT